MTHLVKGLDEVFQGLGQVGAIAHIIGKIRGFQCRVKSAWSFGFYVGEDALGFDFSPDTLVNTTLVYCFVA